MGNQLSHCCVEDYAELKDADLAPSAVVETKDADGDDLNGSNILGAGGNGTCGASGAKTVADKAAANAIAKVAVPAITTVEKKRSDPVAIKAIHTPANWFISKYELKEVIGEGTTSKCCRAVRKIDGVTFACKIIDRRDVTSKFTSSLLDQLSVEVKALDRIRRHPIHHDHIVRLEDYYETTERTYLVLEMVSGGELLDHIAHRGSMTELEAAAIIRQIVSAVRHLHSLNILHRDLKPENILVGKHVFTGTDVASPKETIAASTAVGSSVKSSDKDNTTINESIEPASTPTPTATATAPQLHSAVVEEFAGCEGGPAIKIIDFGLCKMTPTHLSLPGKDTAGTTTGCAVAVAGGVNADIPVSNDQSSDTDNKGKGTTIGAGANAGACIDASTGTGAVKGTGAGTGSCANMVAVIDTGTGTDTVTGTGPDAMVASTFIGSVGYLAPEMLQRRSYDGSVDMWAVGVLSYLILCGCMPYEEADADGMRTLSVADVRKHFVFKLPMWAINLSPEAKDFLRSLLEVDPQLRYTAEQTMRHPFLQMNSACAASNSTKVLMSPVLLGERERETKVSEEIGRKLAKARREMTHIMQI